MQVIQPLKQYAIDMIRVKRRKHRDLYQAKNLIDLKLHYVVLQAKMSNVDYNPKEDKVFYELGDGLLFELPLLCEERVIFLKEGEYMDVTGFSVEFVFFFVLLGY